MKHEIIITAKDHEATFDRLVEEFSTIKLFEAAGLDAAKKRGITVTNTAGALNECVAGCAMALVLNALRKLPQSGDYLRAGLWQTKGTYRLHVAWRQDARHPRTGAHRRGHRQTRAGLRHEHPLSQSQQERLAASLRAGLGNAGENSDVLLVITPGGAETDKLVNAQVLDALGPEGYLVNVARGSVVDELTLPRYLQKNKIAGAGLDVFEHEPKVPPTFFTLDNGVLTPHVASATHETRTAMGALQIENLHPHFAGKPVKTPVV